MKRESRCYEHIGRAAEDSASRDAKKQIAHRLWWLIHADKFNTEEEAIESKLFTLPMQDVYERWAESILSLPRLEVRAEDQELPDCPRGISGDTHRHAFEMWQHSLMDAGFVRVEKKK